MTGKKPVGQVVLVYLIGELFIAVAILPRRSGLDEAGAVFAVDIIGIIKGVEVNGHAAGMG